MGFEKGNKLATGRPKGSLNTRTRRIEELARELNCDPLEILMRFAKGDWQGLGYDRRTNKNTGYDIISPGDRIAASKEAAQYMYAKLKTIEVIKQSQFEGLTLEEKISALEQALSMAKKLKENESR